MTNIKDELRNIIIGDGSVGETSQLKKHRISLEEMQRQASELKNKSISKVKRKLV